MYKDLLNNILVANEIYKINQIKSEWILDKDCRQIFEYIKKLYNHVEINKQDLIKLINENDKNKHELLILINEIYSDVSAINVEVNSLQEEYQEHLILNSLANFKQYDGHTKKELILKLASRLKEDVISEDDLIEVETAKKKVIDKYVYNPKYKLNIGIDYIDKDICGLDDNYVIVGARPSLGKSDLFFNMINNFELNGAKGIFFSLEESETNVIKKLVAINNDIDRMMITKNQVEKHIFEKIMRTKTFNNVKLYFRPCGINRIIDIINIENEKNKLDYVIIDYLGLIKRYTNDWRQEIANISKKLVYVKKELDIAMIVGSQVNLRDEPEYIKHHLGHLKECGDLEADSDIVIFIEGIRESNERALYIAKNRNGVVKRHEIFYNKRNGRFYAKGQI